MSEDKLDFLKPLVEPLLGFSQVVQEDPDWMLLLLGSILSSTRLRGVGRTMQLFAIVHQFDQRYMPLIQKMVTIADKSSGVQAHTWSDLVSKVGEYVQLMAEKNER